MKLKYILAAGVVALLAGCDESRFLDTKPQGKVPIVICTGYR